jgi:DNA-binding LacI/PurR family transcriptional regulator/DNA-binding transcriptional regulator YhcF (GntR family)
MKKNIVFTEKKIVSEVVADHLLDYIKKNKFWGKRLPSQRELSENLNVGLISINKAIKILQETGICVSYHKKGTFVVNHQPIIKGEVKRTKILIISPWDTLSPKDNALVESNLTLPLIHACNEKDIDVVFVRLDNNNEHEDVKYILKEYPPSTVDYVAFNSVFKNPKQIIRIAKNYRSAVMLDHYIEGSEITGVIEDGFNGMKQLTQHLINKGHRRIAFMNISNPEYNLWKYNGFSETMQANGLQVLPSHTTNVWQRDPLIKEFIGKIMTAESPPTAIIGFDDARALFAKEALLQLGYKIGIDVALAGYGDQAWNDELDKNLTSIRFDTKKIGEAAIQYLFNESEPGKLITIDTELIIRQSSERKF